MPFPMVYQVPQGVSDETLLVLRREIVRVTSELMDCPEDWVGVAFFKSALPDPGPGEGAATVLIKLETGLFAGREDDDDQVRRTLQALAEAVWVALKGEYEVEAAVAGWHPGWKFLKEVIE